MLLWRHAPSLGGTRPPRRLMSGWLLFPPALKKLGDAPAVRVPGYLGPFVNLSRGLLCWCSRTRVTPSGSTASPLVCSSRAHSPASSPERLRPLCSGASTSRMVRVLGLWLISAPAGSSAYSRSRWLSAPLPERSQPAKWGGPLALGGLLRLNCSLPFVLAFRPCLSSSPFPCSL